MQSPAPIARGDAPRGGSECGVGGQLWRVRVVKGIVGCVHARDEVGLEETEHRPIVRGPACLRDANAPASFM